MWDYWRIKWDAQIVPNALLVCTEICVEKKFQGFRGLDRIELLVHRKKNILFIFFRFSRRLNKMFNYYTFVQIALCILLFCTAMYRLSIVSKSLLIHNVTILNFAVLGRVRQSGFSSHFSLHRNYKCSTIFILLVRKWSQFQGEMLFWKNIPPTTKMEFILYFTNCFIFRVQNYIGLLMKVTGLVHQSVSRRNWLYLCVGRRNPFRLKHFRFFL